MDKAEFERKARTLIKWAAGNLKENAPVFFVNGCLGHKITLEEDLENNQLELVIFEADNGALNCGSIESFCMTADNTLSMEFDEDEYKFSIVCADDQGYDIEVYQLERMDFPTIELPGGGQAYED